MICSYSFQSPFEVCALFLSISNLLYIRDKLLHVAVYDFYSLLKSVHAGQQFVCGRKRDSDSLTALIWTVLTLASHASLDHKLCLRAFLLLFLRLCRSTVRQVILSSQYLLVVLYLSLSTLHVLYVLLISSTHDNVHAYSCNVLQIKERLAEYIIVISGNFTAFCNQSCNILFPFSLHYLIGNLSLQFL